MAWSTSQLAELAGTTVKTVRYYHQVGVLDEPERAGNGYKHYSVRHLVRLLRVRRLVDLGVPLAQVRELDGDGGHPEEVLRLLDTEIRVTIERLQRVRAELALILEHHAPIDLPDGFSHLASGLTDSDRAMLLVYSQVYDEEAMADVRSMLSAPLTAEDEDFVALPPDADETTRADLAERYAPQVRQAVRDHPRVQRNGSHLRVGEERAQRTIAPAIADLHNPAQMDVLVRVNALNAAAEAAETDDDVPTAPEQLRTTPSSPEENR